MPHSAGAEWITDLRQDMETDWIQQKPRLNTVTRVDQALATLEAVLDLHAGVKTSSIDGEPFETCRNCNETVPCSTRRAIITPRRGAE